MKIVFHRTFEKQFAKLSHSIQQAFYGRLSVFIQDPNSPALNRHSLKGRYVNHQSINITGDMRAIFHLRENDICIFTAIGTHSQLYD